MPRNGSVGLNGRARLCEDTYTNRPGEVVAASSTAAALEAAWAVRSAGMLTLSLADAGFVVREDGADDPIELPYSWRVNGEGFGSRQFWVEKASGTTIGATGAFTLDYEPDDSGEELTASAEVTVVKIKVKADELWPENRVRHIFGPKEEATITVEPVSAGVTFERTLRDHGIVASKNKKWTLTAPDQPGEFSVSLFSGGNGANLCFEVIAPHEIKGVDIRRLGEYDWWALQMAPFTSAYAGVMAYVTTTIVPDWVSFKKVKLYETVAPATERSGWYEDVARFPAASLDHTYANGASQYPEFQHMRVNDGGGIDPGDYIGAWVGYLPSFSNGSYCVSIPVKWFTDGCIVTNTLAVPNVQKVWVRTDGRMRVSKFGLSWERQLYNNFEYPVNLSEEEE